MTTSTGDAGSSHLTAPPGHPSPKWQERSLLAAIALGFAVSFVVLCIDAWDGRIGSAEVKLEDLFPSWLVALTAVIVFLELVAGAPAWSDDESLRVAARIKFVADFLAIAAAGYAALTAVNLSLAPLVRRMETWPDEWQFIAVVIGPLAVLALCAWFAIRRTRRPSQSSVSGEVGEQA